jgi:hypothetical protein
MARKRTLIPALPASSRTLDLLLIGVGVVLVVTWLVGAGGNGMWALGLVCVAVGGLLLLADRFGGASEDTEE